MKTTMSWMLAAALLAAGGAAAGEIDNPFVKANVGDWARYTLSMNMMGMPSPGKALMKVVEKSDKEAVLQVDQEMNIFGQVQKNSQKQTIDLTASFDPTKLMAATPEMGDVKITPIKSDKETIEGGDGQTYECDVNEVAVAANEQGSGTVKIWVSPKAKMAVVKLEMTMSVAMGEQKMEVKMNMALAAQGDANTPDEDA